jgi:cell division protein FtsB
MGMLYEIRLRAGRMAGPMLGICSIVYFGFHVVHGDRGLLTYWRLKAMIAETRPILDGTRKKREQFENRVRLLRPDSLDPDMLEERARIMLNFGYTNDVVIFYEEEIQP